MPGRLMMTVEDTRGYHWTNRQLEVWGNGVSNLVVCELWGNVLSLPCHNVPLCTFIKR
jgi:hypothetical protein